MRRLQIALIALAAICIVAATGIAAYNASYPAAFAAGRAEGYKSGETAGFNRGENDGYQKGYSEGKAAGETASYASGKKDVYDQGVKDGYAEGYKTGNTEGDFAGYKRGYKEGFDVGRLADVPNSYILKDPTSTEVSAFLANDNTNTRQYVLGIYDDRYFARDLCNSAEGHGLRCAYVTIVFTDNTTHEIVAFKISGGAITYYEPQTDNQVQPTINSLWEDNITKETKRIKDILVAW
jgi:hypothetical protein